MGRLPRPAAPRRSTDLGASGAAPYLPPMPPARRPRNSKARRRRRPIPATILVLVVAAGLVLFWRTARGHWPSWPASHPVKLTMDEARAFNASIPLIAAHPIAAPPFRFHGTPAAREQAVQCLATAALYEAGDDPRAQRAVIQVVLNRLALPQYPKTVCGVVYQGSGRTSGCQFSFACDGSVVRRPEYAGWPAARVAARRALAGHVFAAVGTATHYHADWMVPYWMPTLDKVARIGSHLFYRPRRHADAG